jgi:hypothetical protein
MKLYKVDRYSLISIDNERFKFYRIDGMFSYCEDMKGNPVHIHCCAEVKVIESFNDNDKEII